MGSFRWRRGLIAVLIVNAVIWPTCLFAQSQPSPTASDRSNRVSIAYVPPENSALQELYDFLRAHRALEQIQEILSPLRSPEELTIKTMECKEVNSWYTREKSKSIVTICYEYLKRILESLPSEGNSDGLTPADAAVGQFIWVTLHEVGHATFDILDLPIFGHSEDAADNFATYIMLQFGEGQAHRLIAGAAWAWRAYLGDYKKNPVVPLRLSAFGTDHSLPQERFYNLICLAHGADSVGFADFANYLPPTRAPGCAFEYRILVRAFEKEITPHVDQEIARRVLDTNWLSTTGGGTGSPEIAMSLYGPFRKSRDVRVRSGMSGITDISQNVMPAYLFCL
jgi:hypothetical protein